jgi:Fe-S-cluster containining protein
MAGCTQCGECCKKYGWRLEATPLDIARWTIDRRSDILSRVGIHKEGGEVSCGTLWVNPDGSRVSECPFLDLRADGKYYCGIQETKPEVCTTHWCTKYLGVSDGI